MNLDNALTVTATWTTNAVMNKIGKVDSILKSQGMSKPALIYSNPQLLRFPFERICTPVSRFPRMSSRHDSKNKELYPPNASTFHHSQRNDFFSFRLSKFGISILISRYPLSLEHWFNGVLVVVHFIENIVNTWQNTISV